MKIRALLLSVLVFLCLSAISQENDVKEAEKTKSDFIRINKKIVKYFESAYGYAIFPGVGKGALIVGGAGGKGTLFKGGIPVADVTLTQVTVGFQAGGQKFAEVVFFKDAEAYERFISKDFEFSAQLSAIALSADVSLDAPYTDGVLVYTLGEGGLMFEASVGGQKFKTEMY